MVIGSTGELRGTTQHIPHCDNNAENMWICGNEAVDKELAELLPALDAKLIKMETEAEKNITALKIAGLEDLVKRLASQIEALTKQLSAAQAQVQAMAVKAIEGAAGMKNAAGQ